jgi:MFS family permease
MLNYLVALPFVAWMVWRRISRQFGRQPIRRKRMVFRVAIFAMVGVLLALSGLHRLALAEGALGGMLIGAAVGLLGLRLTRFETDPVRGDCYVPNSWIGALLTLLLLGRLAWRFMMIGSQLPPGVEDPMGHAMASHSASPLTMLVIGVLVGYYLAYYSGLLVHHRRFQQAQSVTGRSL